MDTIYYEKINTLLNAFEIYKLLYKDPYSFILDSAMHSDTLGQYSFIGSCPFLRITSKGSQVKIWENTELTELCANPFNILKQYLHQYPFKNHTKFPFIGGSVGYMAYDLCHQLEKLPKQAIDDINLPEMIMGFYDGIIIVDHFSNETYAVSAGLPYSSKEYAKEKVKKLKLMIESSPVPDYTYLDKPYKQHEVNLKSNFTPENYCKAINHVREHIRCGDIYQMNMTQRFTTFINRHPLNIYETLRTINPAPFASFFDFGDFQLVSSSPERFLKITEGIVETRPIKGTMPRGKTEKEDNENYLALKNSTKDRAENLMIVDLMRNDLGRVCKFGTVTVPELFTIEKYPTVFHLVSAVTGKLRDDCDAIDCITAAFPGGSITGAPKVRAMEIIDELEPTRRHIYTGSIGYIGFDGDMDINIAIRTILINKETALYQVGGGIVWDSTAEKEYQETLDKGAALKKALLGRE